MIRAPIRTGRRPTWSESDPRVRTAARKPIANTAKASVRSAAGKSHCCLYTTSSGISAPAARYRLVKVIAAPVKANPAGRVGPRPVAGVAVETGDDDTKAPSIVDAPTARPVG